MSERPLDLDAASPDQIVRANDAVAPNIDDDGSPMYGSAFGYACALTAIMQADAIAMEAHQGPDRETGLDGAAATARASQEASLGSHRSEPPNKGVSDRD